MRICFIMRMLAIYRFEQRSLFFRPNRPATVCLERSQIAQRGLKMTHTILRLPAIIASTGLSRSTIYLRVAQGVFPKPVSLGARAVGWPASEVAALNAARISGRSDSEIRDLVAKLEAARKAAV